MEKDIKAYKAENITIEIFVPLNIYLAKIANIKPEDPIFSRVINKRASVRFCFLNKRMRKENGLER